MLGENLTFYLADQATASLEFLTSPFRFLRLSLRRFCRRRRDSGATSTSSQSRLRRSRRWVTTSATMSVIWTRALAEMVN